MANPLSRSQTGAYSFGAALFHAGGPLSVGLLIFAVISIVLAALYLRSHEAELQRQAERALPGTTAACPLAWRSAAALMPRRYLVGGAAVRIGAEGRNRCSAGESG